MKVAAEIMQNKSAVADKLDPVRERLLEDSGLQEKVSNVVDELLAVLDKDIQHIQESLSCLNELRSLVIKRDDVALSKLLQKIQAEADSYAANELERQSIRKDLADTFDCGVEQITLSALEATLPKGKKAPMHIGDRRIKLKVLIEQIKKEHLSTVLLLSECARFNNLLLRAIFDPRSTSGTEMVMYSPNGATKQQTSTAFVSLQL